VIFCISTKTITPSELLFVLTQHTCTGTGRHRQGYRRSPQSYDVLKGTGGLPKGTGGLPKGTGTGGILKGTGGLPNEYIDTLTVLQMSQACKLLSHCFVYKC
jgi:hypothetical protein